MILEFANPSQFPSYKYGQDSSAASNPKHTAYPFAWGEDNDTHCHEGFNPHFDVHHTYPDGTRIYYDPVKGVYSFEHACGYHRIVAPDHAGEHIPGEYVQFIGGHHSMTVGGHSDPHIAGHYRMNIGGGHYMNVNGDSASFFGGHQAIMNQGHVRHNVGGHYEIRLTGDAAAYGIAVGMEGSSHFSQITITKDNVYVNTNGNIVANAGQNITASAAQNITATAGQGVTINAGQNITINSGAMTTINAQSDVDVNSTGGNINIIAASEIVNITGGVGVNIQGGAIPSPGTFFS